MSRVRQLRRAAAMIALGVVACGAPARTARPARPRTITALTHVAVIDPRDGTVLPDRTIVIDGDRITAVAPGAPAPVPGLLTLDLHGKYVIPGLWDMHVHFAGPMSGPLFVANGVTGVRVMWGNPRFVPGVQHFHDDLRAAFEAGTQVGPRMVIASQIFDGPVPVWPNTLALSTPQQGRDAVRDAKRSGADFIKVYSRLPADVFHAIADESKRQHIPFAGHVPEAVSVAEASDAGQRSIEHLTGMHLACSARERELREQQELFGATNHSASEWREFRRAHTSEAIASYDRDRATALYAKLVANQTWSCPTLTVLHAMASLDDPQLAHDPRLAYVPGIIKWRWNPNVDFRTKELGEPDYAALRAQFRAALTIVHDLNQAGAPLLAGTDETNPYCFPGFSLHDELGWLVEAGLTPAEALRTATWNPARFFGREAELGTVSIGKLADLVVLDANPLDDIANTRRIDLVVSRGVVYDRHALDGLLDQVKTAAQQWPPRPPPRKR